MKLSNVISYFYSTMLVTFSSTLVKKKKNTYYILPCQCNRIKKNVTPYSQVSISVHSICSLAFCVFFFFFFVALFSGTLIRSTLFYVAYYIYIYIY
jgi:hypothetical protein